MLPDVQEWQLSDVDAAAAASSDESVILEKKGAAAFDLSAPAIKRVLQGEIAKQVCAFANAGGGFLVFGVAASGGRDGGVSEHVGSQPVKEWAEQIIPKLPINPPVTGCEAKFVPYPESPAYGALIIQIRVSETRPHFVRDGNRELPYLRVGAHSEPMSLQTFRDIQSRGPSPQIAVEDIRHWDRHLGGGLALEFRPAFQLVSGPLCRHWGAELRLSGDFGTIDFAPGTAARIDRYSVFVEPDILLYPRRRTHVPGTNLTLRIKDAAMIATDRFLRVSLYAESSPPTEWSVSMKDFFTP